MTIFSQQKGGQKNPVPPQKIKTLFEMLKIKKSNPDSKRIGVKEVIWAFNFFK